MEFLGGVSGHKLREKLVGHCALLFSDQEDFGIALKEAQYLGSAMIAHASGQAPETVRWMPQRSNRVRTNGRFPQCPIACKPRVAIEAHQGVFKRNGVR